MGDQIWRSPEQCYSWNAMNISSRAKRGETVFLRAQFSCLLLISQQRARLSSLRPVESASSSALFLHSLSSVSSSLVPLSTQSWLPDPPQLLGGLSRRSRNRSRVGYVWSPTHSPSCSSVFTCFVSIVSDLWYVRGHRDVASRAHNVARRRICQGAEFQVSKEPFTCTISLTSKTPSKR